MPQGGPKMPPGGPLGAQNRPQSPQDAPKRLPRLPRSPPSPFNVPFLLQKGPKHRRCCKYSQNTTTPKHLVKCMVLSTFKRRPARFLGTKSGPTRHAGAPHETP